MVPQIRKILFASDLTENSRHAFLYASGAAARYGARIVLLHVIEKLPAGVRQRLDLLAGEGASEALRAERQKSVQEVLIGKRADFNAVNRALAQFYGVETLQERAFFETCQVSIVEGRAPDEILKAVEEDGCDLIVMGAHRSHGGKTAIGSVGKHVLRRSSVPVLVVPPEQAT